MDKKLISTCRNEGLTEKYSQLKNELFSLAVKCCLRNWKKKEIGSTSQKISYTG